MCGGDHETILAPAAVLGGVFWRLGEGEKFLFGKKFVDGGLRIRFFDAGIADQVFEQIRAVG